MGVPLGTRVGAAAYSPEDRRAVGAKAARKRREGETGRHSHPVGTVWTASGRSAHLKVIHGVAEVPADEYAAKDLHVALHRGRS